MDLMNALVAIPGAGPTRTLRPAAASPRLVPRGSNTLRGPADPR